MNLRSRSINSYSNVAERAVRRRLVSPFTKDSTEIDVDASLLYDTSISEKSNGRSADNTSVRNTKRTYKRPRRLIDDYVTDDDDNDSCGCTSSKSYSSNQDDVINSVISKDSGCSGDQHPANNLTPFVTSDLMNNREDAGFAMQELRELLNAVRSFSTASNKLNDDEVQKMIEVSLARAVVLDENVTNSLKEVLIAAGWRTHKLSAEALSKILDSTLRDLSKKLQIPPGRPNKKMREQRLHEKQGAVEHDLKDANDGALLSTRARSKSEPKLLQLSVTIVHAGSDLPYETFYKLQSFLEQKTVAGLFGYERGGKEANGHAQGVIKIYSSTPSMVTKDIKHFINDKEAIVMCKTLTGKGLHTFTGMIGYCIKDMGQPHFKMAKFNISEEELLAGREEHVVKGAGMLKKKTVLGQHNLMTQMINYSQYHMPSARVGPTRVLASMLQSGKYYPSASWAITGFGKGLDSKRFDAIWKCLMCPELVDRNDVETIFINFNPAGRYNGETVPYVFPDDNAWDNKTLDTINVAALKEKELVERRELLITENVRVHDADGFPVPEDISILHSRREMRQEMEVEICHDASAMLCRNHIF